MSDPVALEVSRSDFDLGCIHVPLRFEDATFETFDPTIGKAAEIALRSARRLAEGEIGGLLLAGPVGCGKTHLAAAACNALGRPIQDRLARAEDRERDARDAREDAFAMGPADRDRTAVVLEFDAATTELRRATRALERECPVWLNVPSYLGHLRRGYSQDGRRDDGDTIEAMDARGLLVIDDLGAEKASDWTAATLFEIVAARYDAMTPTLVTSNLSARELASAGYGRIVSRLADEGALIELASASDYRMRLRKRLTA